MPSKNDFSSIDTSKPVLVTGATGYIAGVLIKQLLDIGCIVHGTVRDPSKTKRLQYLYDVAKGTPGTLKFFKGDLLIPGSFYEAAQGCHILPPLGNNMPLFSTGHFSTWKWNFPKNSFLHTLP